jgi:hypothetical protein
VSKDIIAMLKGMNFVGALEIRDPRNQNTAEKLMKTRKNRSLFSRMKLLPSKINVVFNSTEVGPILTIPPIGCNKAIKPIKAQKTKDTKNTNLVFVCKNHRSTDTRKGMMIQTRGALMIGPLVVDYP